MPKCPKCGRELYILNLQCKSCPEHGGAYEEIECLIEPNSLITLIESAKIKWDAYRIMSAIEQYLVGDKEPLEQLAR